MATSKRRQQNEEQHEEEKDLLPRAKPNFSTVPLVDTYWSLSSYSKSASGVKNTPVKFSNALDQPVYLTYCYKVAVGSILFSEQPKETGIIALYLNSTTGRLFGSGRQKMLRIFKMEKNVCSYDFGSHLEYSCLNTTVLDALAIKLESLDSKHRLVDLPTNCQTVVTLHFVALPVGGLSATENNPILKLPVTV